MSKKTAELRSSARGPELALFATYLFMATAAVAATVPFDGHTVDGTFDGAHSVFAADVDGDGDIDLLGAAAEADDITWWENTAGDGSAWTEHTIDGSFDGAFSVFTADVDGDGDTDVLGAALLASDITWWENTAGDGSAWAEHTIDGSFSRAVSVFAADVDGDGDTDVLGAAVVADDITWWENTAGDGSAWTEHTIDGSFDGAASVHTADVDGDGDLDVLGAAFDADDITWWENTAGDGSFWTEHTIDGTFGGATSVVATDIDGDGDTDVIGAANGADDVTWWQNTAGDGSAWIKHVIDGAFNGARSLSATDLDGDGDTDVLAAAENADDVTWWENSAGDGSSWTEHSIAGAFDGALSVFATDVDGDGDTDVLAAAEVADDVTWWENTSLHRSATYPAASTIDGAFDGASSVFATDVDGDGDTDVLGAAVVADDITWWENTAGDGSTWTEHTIDGSFDSAFSVFATDVDGDGDTDVLGAGLNVDDITWWENTAGDGSAWTEHTIDGSFDGALSVFATDVDGDGDTDVLGAAGAADDITWWENRAGDGSTWTEHTIDGASDARSIYATDVDDDGDTDVLGAALFADDITWWENTAGDGSAWTEHTIDGDFAGANSVYATDVDGDGDTDVLGAAFVADDITWWENTAGDGSAWTEHTIDGAFAGANSVYATDVDGDGDTDVLGAGLFADEATWWENTAGDGSAWTEHILDGAFDGARSIYATDVDGDGNTDVLGGARGVSSKITWWENQGGEFALPTVDLAPNRVGDGAKEAVLAITATHRGRAGDSDAELATLELLLTDATATPLTVTQADDLLVALSIYLDDGSTVFEAETDIEVSFVTSFPLAEGVLSVPFFDDDPDAQFAVGAPKTHFVVAELEPDASQRTPDDLQLTHLTEASSTGEDAVHDLPITLEFSSDTLSGMIEVNDAPIALPDFFAANQDLSFSGNLLDDNGAGADTDEENDVLTASMVGGGPANGILVGGLQADGTFTYQPNAGFVGDDSFAYELDDGLSTSSTAIVTISVRQVVIFADGFESGNTSAWSSSIP